MPYDFVRMHQRFGHESRLITMFSNTINFPEDISLNFKLPSGRSAKKWRDKKAGDTAPVGIKYNSPKNLLEKIYFTLRDEKNRSRINEAIKRYDLFAYDIYHFDGGMDFFRDLRFAKELKRRGKKIVCCYFGSDLRTRGIFKELDEMSDLNLTVEYDHLSLHKNIHYVFFPFDVNEYEMKKRNNKKIRIIHSPTNRKFKGTDKILGVIAEVEKERQIEFILLENIDRDEVLKIKSSCDLAIDQVGGEMGGTGYGKNSIENLSMGIPTFTEFTDDYLKFISENPFIHSTVSTLKDNLISLIDNEALRNDTGRKGRAWVEKYHSFESVNAGLKDLYNEFNIVKDVG